MIHDKDKFYEALKTVLLSDYGLSLESEGTVYVRSLDGEYAAGLLADDGAIEYEKEFEDDIDSAIRFFIEERQKRNHGSVL